MKLEFDLCPTFLVGMCVKVMIFTQPLNLRVKSLLAHADRVREAYSLNPPKSDKFLQLLLEVKAKVKRGPCLGWGGNVCLKNFKCWSRLL